MALLLVMATLTWPSDGRAQNAEETKVILERMSRLERDIRSLNLSLARGALAPASSAGPAKPGAVAPVPAGGASGYALSPRSKIDDGSLEVLMFPTRNVFSLIAYLLSKNKSRHCIKMEGVTSLDVSSNHAIQIDGDYACRGPATIRVAPGSLKVLADARVLTS